MSKHDGVENGNRGVVVSIDFRVRGACMIDLSVCEMALLLRLALD